MYKDFKGKSVLITGSSRGIGLASAKLLHSLGAKVILNSKDTEELSKAASELGGVEHHVCDITNSEQTAEMIEGILKDNNQRLDFLVNNAGGGGWAGVLDEDVEWQKSFDLDLMGAVRVCRHALPAMKNHKFGSVVNVASMWGIPHTAKPEIASYCAMKAALCKLTEILAQEWAPEIRVNAVAPGWTKTRMLLDGNDEEDLKFMSGNILLKRLAEPEEIAKVIVFLLSSESSYITGQILPTDGGYLLNRTHQ